MCWMAKVQRCLSYLYSRFNEVTFMSYKPCAVSRRGAIGLTWSTELYEAQMLSFPQLHNAATKMVFAPPFYCHSLRNLNDGDHRHRHVHQGILLLQSHQAVEIKMEACNSKKKVREHASHSIQYINCQDLLSECKDLMPTVSNIPWNIEYRLRIHVVCLSPTKTTPHHAHLLQKANNNCSIRQLDK